MKGITSSCPFAKVNLAAAEVQGIAATAAAGILGLTKLTGQHLHQTKQGSAQMNIVA